MKKKLTLPLLVILIAFTAFFTSSCSHNFYAPTTAPTPLFKQKGETQLAVHAGYGNEIDQSFQIQTAAALDSHLAVFSSVYAARGGFKKTDLDNNNGTGSQMELAVGYFSSLGSKLNYEVYGGLGYGKVTNTYNLNYKIENNFFKPFVQGNMGYRSPFFDAVFTTRVGFLHIGGIKEFNDSGFVSNQVSIIKSKPNSMLIEPGVTFRMGYEPFKVQVHLGRSFNLNGETYPQEKTVLSFGIVTMLRSATKVPVKVD